jgi:hypothetical protein
LKSRVIAHRANQRLAHATGDAEHDQCLRRHLRGRAGKELFNALEECLLARFVAAVLQ